MIKHTYDLERKITYTLRKLVAANNCVLFGASSTLVIDITGSKTRKYTTASTATVTESFVKIYICIAIKKSNDCYNSCKPLVGVHQR
jgi:hypothetical protein